MASLFSAYFYPRPPRGGRLVNAYRYYTDSVFLSTPPARGATFSSITRHLHCFISIHAPREGGDPCFPLRRQTGRNFYPRPPRGGRHVVVGHLVLVLVISIHAPREGGDVHVRLGNFFFSNFYPRPPRGGRRPQGPPLRGLTDFYPRPPRGGRPDRPGPRLCGGYFYPRPPRGGRPTTWQPQQIVAPFLSTPPARGATRWQIYRPYSGMISIHAPREGGDGISGYDYTASGDFYPRPPRGGRLDHLVFYHLGKRFLSTPPARGATALWRQHCQLPGISIHAPREGGDHGRRRRAQKAQHFYPRPPRGGRRPVRRYNIQLCAISIHAPREGGDEWGALPT